MITLIKATRPLAAGTGFLVLAMSSGAQPYYGSQLMTLEEWAKHWTTLRRLPPAEQEAYRAQHHQEIKKRAEAMGLPLPDQPPSAGMGRGRAMVPGAWGPGYGPRGSGYWEPGYSGWGRPCGRRGRGGPWHRGWGG
jgi:hypothetical protein